MPYGPAPAWCFWVFEATSYIFFVLCFVHAWRRGKQALAYLIGGLLFGLTLEYLEVLSHSYSYGHFGVMLGRTPFEIPLCIGCGWAIIMYTARLFSDTLGYRPLSAAALDTLLAINIDLSLDVVAYRLHMWHWYWTHFHLNPLTAQWFGIPYGNFIGWITVVFCYSLFSRLLERKLTRNGLPGAVRAASIALLALIASQAVLTVTEGWVFEYMNRLGINSQGRFLLFMAILLALAIYGWFRRTPRAQSMPPLATWTPAWFHVFCISCFFGLGFFHENRWMTAVAVANVIVGLGLHFWPWQRTAAATYSKEPAQPLEAEPA
jgi:uncharacterized membrane protein